MGVAVLPSRPRVLCVLLGAVVALPASRGSAQEPETPVPIEELAGPPVDWEKVLASGQPGCLFRGFLHEGEPVTGPELAETLFSYADSVAEWAGVDLLALAPATERPVDALGLWGTTERTLSIVGRATGGLVWEQLGHGLVCCFGTEADMQRLREGPPDSLPPVMLRCGSPASVLLLIHEFWGVDIAAEPRWLRRAEARLLGPFRDQAREHAVWVAAHHEPIPFAEWMENVATRLGGEVERTETQWIFRSRVDGTQLRGAADRLLATLRADELPSMTLEAHQLGRLGESAVPVLAAALKPTEPALAQAIVRALGEIGSPAAVEPLLAVLEWPASLPHEHFDDSPVTELPLGVIKALGQIGDARAAPELETRLADPETDADLKQAIWVALGNCAPESLPEERFPRTVKTALAGLQLNLVSKTDAGGRGGSGDERPIPIQELCQDEAGEWWAALFFARYGGGSDIWLTHSPDREAWGDYLFTGCTLHQYRAGGHEAEIEDFDVSGDAVTLAWGRPEEKTRRAVLSIDKLRRDTDEDGLTDILERRLCTDPKRPDTDGDGLSDAEDGNPLAAPNPRPTDEQQIIQAAFAHLYRHDASRQVKLVSVFGEATQELYGYAGPVLTPSRKQAGRFHQEVGCGPEWVSFVSHKQVGDEWTETSPIAFARNGRLARIEVSTYRDGLWAAGYHAVLKKVGGRWVIVEWERDWVS